jgi:hypothetical protein
MTKVNFKIGMMAIAIGMFVLTSCGGGGSKQQGGSAATETKTEQAASANSGGLEVKNVNKDNWQAVIKAQREGLDFPLPDGWSVESVEDEYGNNVRLIVVFNVGGSTTAEQFGQLLLYATKAIAKNGNHKIDITENGAEEGKAIEKFSDASDMGMGLSFPASWCYTVGYVYTVYLYYDESKKQLAVNI